MRTIGLRGRVKIATALVAVAFGLVVWSVDSSRWAVAIAVAVVLLVGAAILVHVLVSSLERAVSELAEERDRVHARHEFGQRLAAETELETMALTILEGLARLGGAHVGSLYAVRPDAGGGLRLAASHGLHPDELVPELTPEDGPAGRALAGQELVAVAGGERHELQLPLVQSGRVLGVASLGRTGEPFSPVERDALAEFADQAAVALSAALALRGARREATITRAVLDATPDGICLTDSGGEILLANAPLVDLTVNVLELPLEGTVHERLLAAAERMTDPDAYRAGMAAIAADPELESRQEYTLAGSGRSFQGYVAPVRDSTGRVVGRLFALRETTAERQAERLKDELVATVSHELRTPLTSIFGYLELVLAEDGGPLADTHRRFLEIVDRNARRLLAVVGDLLFVAQVEAGLRLDVEPVDLWAVAAEAVEAARPLADRKGVELRLEGERDLAAIGDRVRLAQLVANLVSNAVKFTPAGGHAAVRVRPGDRAVVLEVEDTGIGIPESEQERLFERFFRSSSASEHAIQGTGLGLVICKAIAEAHGGSISFTSEAGVGTTFRVELPLAAHVGAAAEVA